MIVEPVGGGEGGEVVLWDGYPELLHHDVELGPPQHRQVVVVHRLRDGKVALLIGAGSPGHKILSTVTGDQGCGSKYIEFGAVLFF